MDASADARHEHEAGTIAGWCPIRGSNAVEIRAQLGADLVDGMRDDRNLDGKRAGRLADLWKMQRASQPCTLGP